MGAPTQNARGFAPGVRVTKFAGPVAASTPQKTRRSEPSFFPGPSLRTDAETPLPWRVSGAAGRLRPVTAAAAVIPSKGIVTKRLRGAAWILPALCGYRATKPNRHAGLRLIL